MSILVANKVYRYFSSLVFLVNAKLKECIWDGTILWAWSFNVFYSIFTNDLYSCQKN